MSLQAVKVLLIAQCLITLTLVTTAQVCTRNGISFVKGESISVPSKCMQVTCEDPVTNRQSGIICAYTSPARGCRLSNTDYSKPYPQCCPIEIC